MANTSTTAPLKDIPGSYGIPLISPIKDRLDFYYNAGGNDGFFKDRVDKYKSTVFRCNMAPGPFMAANPQVITLLDAKSFPVLFDVSKVEKKDVFTGTFMPPVSLTGGYRVCSYLDPSEENHKKVKQLLFNLLASRHSFIVPAFKNAYAALFDKMEADLAQSGKSDFNKLSDAYAFEFLGQALFGLAPSSTELGTTAPDKVSKWLLFNLHPLMTLGLPKILEELLLHTFHLPSFLIKKDYNALYKYFEKAAAATLDGAEELGLSREEACHNILFATCFNTFGGMKVLFPGILQFLAQTDRSVHQRLAEEIRSAVAAADGEVTPKALEEMKLTKSFVYECLRMDPPVKFQYGKAKQDLVVESHDAAFKIKKGEMIFGYQPFATRDEVVFANANQFVADRFVGEEGEKLLKYVVWSNGPETENPTVQNKQCAGKLFVVLMARLLLVEFFLRYDTFKADVGKILLGAQVTVTSLAKATANVAS